MRIGLDCEFYNTLRLLLWGYYDNQWYSYPHTRKAMAYFSTTIHFEEEATIENMFGNSTYVMKKRIINKFETKKENESN